MVRKIPFPLHVFISMIDFIAHLAPIYLYPFLFMGITFLGGLVLMPALYLSTIGAISLAHLFLTTVFAGMVSDSVWYLIGYYLKKDRLYSFSFIKNKVTQAERFSDFFSKHGILLVYFTKFIYGTRIASHVLAGMHKIEYLKFLAVTAAGTATWFIIFYFLIRSLDVGITAAKAAAFKVQIIFLVGIVFLAFVNWFTGTFIRKRLMRAGKL